jgi:alkanesulfonate monooxygenase SsuD/methylene tetrahydromethanopterin reductase-like flavin-dependent oxidoreductase (luciferase family)
MSSVNMLRNARGLSQAPIDDIESYWTPLEKVEVKRKLACSIYGSPETVRTGIERLVERTQADELMIVSDVFDHNARLRSFELIAASAPAYARP